MSFLIDSPTYDYFKTDMAIIHIDKSHGDKNNEQCLTVIDYLLIARKLNDGGLRRLNFVDLAQVLE